jgi:hypothetical protein
MGRRRWPFRYECTFPGCTQSSHHEFHSLAELKQQLKWQPRETWRCVRHSRAEEVLSSTNPIRTVELTNFEEPHGKFWGTTKAQCGYQCGPGFQAFAVDFPAGTRLRVTAEIIYPTPITTEGGDES